MKPLMYAPLLFWLISCNESDENTFSSKIEALKNGSEWKGRTEINFHYKTDTLIISGATNESENGVFVMKIKFEGPGNYTLKRNQAFYYSTIGDDLITGEYKIDQDGDGQVEVSIYDPDSKAISGRFDVKLKKVRSIPENNIEYLNFTDGFFQGSVRSVDW